MANLVRRFKSMTQLPDWSRIAAVFNCKPSAIQRLPWNVVELIIHFIQAGYLSSSQNSVPVDDRTYLRPLFRTCQNLRSGALQIACRECKFVYGPHFSDVYMDLTYWPLHMLHPQTIKCEYVLDVVLCIDSWSVYSGMALDEFQKSRWKDFVFPNAYKLKINFRDYVSKFIFNADSYLNIYKFAKFIRTILPNIVTVDLDDCWKNSPNDELISTLGNVLMNCLYGNTQNKVLKSSFGNLAITMESSPILELTDVTFTICNNLNAMALFVRKNHKSLKILNLLCTFKHDINSSEKLLNVGDIICEDGNNVITYPRLQKLCIITYGEEEYNQSADPIEQTIFPRLKYLQANFYGNFPDQKLFCCHKTLEYLNMSVKDRHARMLNLSNIFGKGKFLKLKQVQLTGKTIHNDNSLCTNAILKLAFDAGNTTTVVNIKDFEFHDIQLNTCLELVELKSIKRLDLDRAKLEFSNLKVILKALPSLHYLACAFISIDDEYSTTTFAKLVDDMTVAHHPLNMNLVTITAKGGGYVNSVLAAKCAMLIAVLCPRFANVLINSIYVADFNREALLLFEESGLDDCIKKRLPSLIFTELV